MNDLDIFGNCIVIFQTFGKKLFLGHVNTTCCNNVETFPTTLRSLNWGAGWCLVSLLQHHFQPKLMLSQAFLTCPKQELQQNIFHVTRCVIFVYVLIVTNKSQ
jgi:hypothetical protein